MSDETGPALSRRALREARRAEAEAQLAKDATALGDQQDAAVKPKAATNSVSAPKSQPPVPTKPAAPAKPATSAAAAPKAQAQTKAPAATPVQKPAAAPKAAAKPVAAKPAAKVEPKPAVVKPVAVKPVVQAESKPEVAKPVVKTEPKSEAAVEADPEAPSRSRRAAAGEVDALSTRTERSSLQRARDRDALRTRRRLEAEVSELSVKNPAPAEDPAPLTRKQMRLQTLGAAKDAAKPGNSEPEPRAAQIPAQQAKNAAPSPEAKPAVDPAASATDAAAARLSVEEALALRRRSGGAVGIEPLLLAPEEDLAEVDLEVLAQQRELAARAAIISRRAAERLRLEEENTQRAGSRRSDPFTGAMNHLRDEEIEKKLVNTGVSGPLTRGYNLAMTDQGTIVDSLKNPAAPAAKTPASAPATPKPMTPAAKAPAVTPAQKPKAATPAPAPARDSTSPAASPAAAAAPARKVAEKSATAAPKAVAVPDPGDAMAENVVTAPAGPPVRAVRAQGLEPLDVQTAGMRRANNMYLMVIAALSVGGAALVAGLIMFLNSI
ncbi:hypothetical protein [Paeniglutamicibacter sp. Y32M11]|uniref:hypothetical protein n=1 Tax=Paeniglutamicibacter sp. Y32M11 TaxID=2853258 RepID=UPI001C52D09A|nr:hypothetical protein [Paeniglutamicibacter sp. Y32M11]QXQ11795.1 hypothetical protein KUF55_07955 [Paeniglutamicibacter sp. Y32M11]